MIGGFLEEARFGDSEEVPPGGEGGRFKGLGFWGLGLVNLGFRVWGFGDYAIMTVGSFSGLP